ncbi:unnamed protein product, partial [Phaeothamnion confervicola]
MVKSWNVLFPGRCQGQKLTLVILFRSFPLSSLVVGAIEWWRLLWRRRRLLWHARRLRFGYGGRRFLHPWWVGGSLVGGCAVRRGCIGWLLQVERACRRLVSSSRKAVEAFDFNATNVAFSPQSSAFRKQVTTVCGYPCRAYECACDVRVAVHRKGANLVRGLPRQLYFDPQLTLYEAAARHERAEPGWSSGGSGADGAAEGQGDGNGGRGGKCGHRGAASGGGWGWLPFGGGDKGRKCSTEADVDESAAVAAAAAALGERKPHRKVEKRLKATMFMADTFPIQLADVMPIIEVMAMKDDLIQRLRSVLTSAGVPRHGFPVKINVPLVLSVKAVVSFENFSQDPASLSDDVFELPRDYAYSARISRAFYAG